jgi:hypothetical protein
VPCTCTAPSFTAIRLLDGGLGVVVGVYAKGVLSFP